jgi:alkanesulfonate monooxygenase SsuD/methylene tetrahydromethanopterin reductase-like flavin-dependent oxidoreductase (luciferase family)
LKFGLQHPNYSFDYRNHDSSHIVDSLRNLVTRAETLGFDSFWVMDHLHQNGARAGKQDEPMLESWTTISVLAGVTSKIKLGTMMTGVIYRHPSILAKIGATLHCLTTCVVHFTETIQYSCVYL